VTHSYSTTPSEYWSLFRAAHRFGRQVQGRANQLIAGRRTEVRCAERARDLRDAEIENFRDHLAIGPAREEDVARLQVAVNDAPIVSRPERRGNRNEQARDLALGELFAALEMELQIFPLQEFHHQVGCALVDPDVRDVHDVGVLDGGRRLTFVQEALASVRARQ
jgi:hypothetical protein